MMWRQYIMAENVFAIQPVETCDKLVSLISQSTWRDNTLQNNPTGMIMERPDNSGGSVY